MYAFSLDKEIFFQYNIFRNLLKLCEHIRKEYGKQHDIQST